MSRASGRRVFFSGWVAAGLRWTGLLGLAAAPALAGVGSGGTAIEGYALNVDDRAAETPALSNVSLPVSIGVSGMIEKRKLDFDDFGTRKAEMRHVDGYAGLDLLPWLTVRAMVGAVDFKSSRVTADRLGADLEWGAGVEAHLLNRHVEPTLINISWIRCDASVQYAGSQIKDAGNKVERVQISSDLTFSVVTTPKDIDTVKSVALFLGPALSSIRGKLEAPGGVRSDFNEGQLVGLIGGLALVPHDDMSIKLELQMFDELSYAASFSYHF